MPYPEVVIPKPTRARNIDQEIPVTKPLPGNLFSCSMKLPIGTVAVHPRMIEVEIVKDLFQGS
jgi:hypothetical protein